MKVGVIQSAYIPWRGYFDFIASVDTFIFYDDVQYSKNSWRNRNRIKTSQGSEWITVPVRHDSLSQSIKQTKIANTYQWGEKHIAKLEINYGRAPYINDVLDMVSFVKDQEKQTISELNIELTKRICSYLGIKTRMIVSDELSLSGTKTERLMDLLQKLKASCYLSGPSADEYLDKEAFRLNTIRLEYKSYDYEPYPQLWETFDGLVSILDLIANCGPYSMQYVRSKSPDRVIIK